VTPPALAVVLVTHDSAEHVEDTLRAVVAQMGPGDELVVVDNASSDGTVDAVRRAAAAARVVRSHENLGFAGGANRGAAATTAPLLFFLNPDAVPATGCLDALRTTAAERPGWAAWQPLVTQDDGRLVNTSGGVVHFLGMGWSGDCGKPSESVPPIPVEVGFASGAALAVRRGDWEELGGFEQRYFMYGEDLDLGLRLWLAGRGVGLAPEGRVEHAYDFHKGSHKWLLLERNRWWTVLSAYPGALLALLLPGLLAAEVALLALAARDGWLRAKLRAQATVVRELPAILQRRRAVQAARRVGAGELARRLTADLDSPFIRLGGPAAAVQRAYWAFVARLLVTRPRTSARSPRSRNSA
jgi:GT2 family glycosyltransferase